MYIIMIIYWCHTKTCTYIQLLSYSHGNQFQRFEKTQKHVWNYTRNITQSEHLLSSLIHH